MAYLPYTGFCGPAYQQTGARIDLSVDQAINCYVHRNEIGTGKTGPGLVKRPGYVLFSTPAAAGVGRALWAGENRLFCIVGTKLIEVDSVGVQTVRGDIGSGSKPCGIFSNTTQLMIINPDTDVVSVDDGASVTTPATPAGGRMGFMLGGRGYIVAPNTNTIFQSDTQLATGFLTWDPLEQSTIITSQDRILATIADHDGAWLIGSATSNYMEIAGVAGFNLTPNRAAFVQIGTCAPYSPAAVSRGICMVSGSRRGYGEVVVLTPGNATRISTYAVEASLATVTDWDAVTGIGYTDAGHEFYELDVPGAGLNLTWVYDFTEKAWHQRRGWSGSAYQRMLGRMTQCTFNNNYYVISPTNGKIYKQSNAVNADDGVTFRSQRTGPVLYGNRLANYNHFRMDTQINDGALTVGWNARFSMDGGLTWGTYSYETMGRNGEPNVLEWPQLGQAGIRGFVADVYCDQGDFAVAGASVDVTPGAN